MGQKIKDTFNLMDRRLLACIMLLLGSGSGSGITALRGGNDELAAEVAEVHDEVMDIKLQLARFGQKLEDFIDHSREMRKTATVRGAP